MTTNRRWQMFGTSAMSTPIGKFWQLGTLTDVDPDIPNLPLEASAVTPQNPYTRRVSDSVIVSSWTLETLPQPRQNKQIVDNTPPVDNPPVISEVYPQLISSLWVSEVPLQAQRKVPPASVIAVTDQPKNPSDINTLVASWFFTFTMPQRSPLAVLSSPPIPFSSVNLNIVAGSWAPFVLPQATRRSVATLGALTIDSAPGDSRNFQANLVPTTWAVDFFDPRLRKSIAVFTPNLDPIVIPGTPAGGVMPYTEVARLGWGAIRAYPQVVFDVAYEQAPRGLPNTVSIPSPYPIETVLIPESEKQQLARFAEAAAAFDLDLVRKYLEAIGMDLDG